MDSSHPRGKRAVRVFQRMYIGTDVFQLAKSGAAMSTERVTFSDGTNDLQW